MKLPLSVTTVPDELSEQKHWLLVPMTCSALCLCKDLCLLFMLQLKKVIGRSPLHGK